MHSSLLCRAVHNSFFTIGAVEQFGNSLRVQSASFCGYWAHHLTAILLATLMTARLVATLMTARLVTTFMTARLDYANAMQCADHC